MAATYKPKTMIKTFYCPHCGRQVVLSGNWAGCRNRECGGGAEGRNWQGRIRDLEEDDEEGEPIVDTYGDALLFRF